MSVLLNTRLKVNGKLVSLGSTIDNTTFGYLREHLNYNSYGKSWEYWGKKYDNASSVLQKVVCAIARVVTQVKWFVSYKGTEYERNREMAIRAFKNKPLSERVVFTLDGKQHRITSAHDALLVDSECRNGFEAVETWTRGIVNSFAGLDDPIKMFTVARAALTCLKNSVGFRSLSSGRQKEFKEIAGIVFAKEIARYIAHLVMNGIIPPSEVQTIFDKFKTTGLINNRTLVKNFFAPHFKLNPLQRAKLNRMIANQTNNADAARRAADWKKFIALFAPQGRLRRKLPKTVQLTLGVSQIRSSGGTTLRISPTRSIPALVYLKPSMDRQWLFKGTQEGCNGSVSFSRAESIRAQLNIHRPNGIRFNQKKVVPSLEGGVCTAMSLEFLDLYLKAKRISIKKPNSQSEMLIDRLVKLRQNLSSSSQEMRNRQAAYNTIEVHLNNSLDDPLDWSRNKIQSLANYHSLVIDYSSLEIDVDKLDHESCLAQKVEALPEGAFLIRIIKPANNEKLEVYGHSLIYIKEHGLGLFYDPNAGLIELSPLEHPKILFEEFKIYFHAFGLSKAKFYRLKSA